MIDGLFRFFQEQVADTHQEPAEDATSVRLAAIALMLEVARSDTDKQPIELRTIEQLLSDEFDFPNEHIKTLMDAASDKVEAAHDLYQFTQLINAHYSQAGKQKLLLAMWQVAFADGHILAIENHIIRRVAGLIHISHADFIRLKIQARDG